MPNVNMPLFGSTDTSCSLATAVHKIAGYSTSREKKSQTGSCFHKFYELINEPCVNKRKTETNHRLWKLQKHLSPRLRIHCPNRIEAASTLTPCWQSRMYACRKKTPRVTIH